VIGACRSKLTIGACEHNGGARCGIGVLFPSLVRLVEQVDAHHHLFDDLFLLGKSVEQAALTRVV